MASKAGQSSSTYFLDTMIISLLGVQELTMCRITATAIVLTKFTLLTLAVHSVENSFFKQFNYFLFKIQVEHKQCFVSDEPNV